jgi:uncharacterized protein (DUF427 family)
MTQPENPGAPRIEHDHRRIRVFFGGHGVADSKDAIVLREPGRRPVWYFPRHDVEMTVLGQTSKATMSPTKGVATYFTINRDAHVVEDAIWSFEVPPPAFQAIAGRLAFEPIHFEFEAEGHTTAEWELDCASPTPGGGDAAPLLSPKALASAIRRAAAAHHVYEERLGYADPNWPDWYAAYIMADQASLEPPS